jgi:ferredoxin--NADP+ reductase
MESVVRNLDLAALDAELERARPVMEANGQDVQAAREYILSSMPKALEPVSKTRFHFDFLASPTRILGDEMGNVIGLEVEDTTLISTDKDTKARGLGTYRVLDVDSVVFCIGDRVDENFGLPTQWTEYVKNPAPRYPVDGVSYEAYDPLVGAPIEGIFVAGWSREASSGLVGVARKDGENGAQAVLEYLKTLTPLSDTQPVVEQLHQALAKLGGRIIVKDDLWILEAIEKMEAQRRGLDFYKMKTNEEMLEALKSN